MSQTPYTSGQLSNNSEALANRSGRLQNYPTNTAGFPALPMPPDLGANAPAEPRPEPRRRNNSAESPSTPNQQMRAVPQSPLRSTKQRGSSSTYLDPIMPPASPIPSAARPMPAPAPRSNPMGSYPDRKPFFTTSSTPFPGENEQVNQSGQGNNISRQPTGGQAKIDLDAWTAKNRPPKSQGGVADTLSRPNPNLPSGQSGALPRTVGQRPQNNSQPTGSMQRLSATNQQVSPITATKQPPLNPDGMLRNGRYRLHEKQGQQDWLNGVYEAHWLGHDSQHPNSRVLICEVMLPDITPVVQQSLLRTATMALSSVGRHPHIAALWDAFNEQGRTFFVFEHIEGESLRMRAQRLGRPLTEQEAVEWCLQMAEVLDLLSQQSPPLVHGMISPDMISVNAANNHYLLTNFSIILAGGATQFISGIDRAKLSPYTLPEFSRGLIDGRSDLYSLLASTYYIVTGTVPSRSNGNGAITSARSINIVLSPEFDAILTRGLRPVAAQRYQRPSELRQDLLAIRSVNSTLTVLSDQGMAQNSGPLGSSAPFNPASMSGIPDHIADALPILRSEAVVDEEEDYSPLLPRPEELTPLPEQNDLFVSTLWFSSLLVGVGVLAIVARMFS
ncbi:MAG TPA: protein kinase [Ktedonobacteraceae bacterium]|nr:protein kinase [Ktedonobacteraceae bacterium]